MISNVCNATDISKFKNLDGKKTLNAVGIRNDSKSLEIMFSYHK